MISHTKKWKTKKHESSETFKNDTFTDFKQKWKMENHEIVWNVQKWYFCTDFKKSESMKKKRKSQFGLKRSKMGFSAPKAPKILGVFLGI